MHAVWSGTLLYRPRLSQGGSGTLLKGAAQQNGCTDPISLKGIQRLPAPPSPDRGCTDPISLKGIQLGATWPVGDSCCTDPISLKGIQPRPALSRGVTVVQTPSLSRGSSRAPHQPSGGAVVQTPSLSRGSSFRAPHLHPQWLYRPHLSQGDPATYGLDSESSIRKNFKDLCRNICSTFCTSKTVFT